MLSAFTDIAPNMPTWQRLPPRMRVLFIAAQARTGVWLTQAFANDSATTVLLEEAVGSTAGMERLRDDVFDAVLVHHVPGRLDALDLVEGFRTGGAEEPIIVLGEQTEQEMAPLCYEVGADGYVSIQATTRNLLWVLGRAIQRRQLVCENQRLAQAEQSQRQREQDEAAATLEQQQLLVAVPGATPIPNLMPEEVVAHYRELLRTYVIMGSGNLAEEVACLAKVFVTAGLTASQALHLHLHVLQELVAGLGSRSARHVMTRADLLGMELLMHLADGYRGRYQERIDPPLQQMLPGFG